MKRFILIGIAAALTGCHSISIPTPNGMATVTSLGQKVSIGGLTFGPNGQLVVTNYNLDQVSGIQAIGAVILQGIAAGGKTAVMGTEQPLQPGLYRFEKVGP